MNRFRNHCLLRAGSLRLVITYFDPLGVGLLFVFFAVLFLILGSKGSGDFAVEGGEVGFKGFKLVFLTPLLGDDGFKLGNVSFEFGGAFLVLGNDTGYLLQSIDEVHAGGVGVGHGDEAVVELVFVVAFNHKSVLYGLLAVNNCTLRDNADGKTIDLAGVLNLGSEP